MISKQVIIDEINAIRLRISESGDKKAKFTKEKSRINFLNHVLAYLETEPREEYLLREQSRLSALIDSTNSRFVWWCNYAAPSDVAPNDRKAYFAKITGLATYRKQLRAINFILGL